MNTKRFLACFLTLALALGLAACSKPAPAPSSAPLPESVAPAPSVATAAAPAQSTEGADAMKAITPPYEEKMRAREIPEFLSPDLQELYNAAEYLAYHFFVSTGFDVDTTAAPLVMDNGMSYYPDNGFESYHTFRAALDASFTEEYAIQLCNDSMAYADDGNGVLYSLEADRGTNILYKNSTFAQTSETDTEMIITVTAHYAKEIIDNGEFGKEEETRDFELLLKKTDAGWRFSQFELPY